MWDSAEGRAGGHDALSPMQIAHHPLFTAREKIELLHQLKAEVTQENAGDPPIGATAEEIDAAIAEVRQDVQQGVGSETVLGGDA
jgi:hypothetical protein